jgi:hypothetical protein
MKTLILIAALAGLTSCTLTVAPDGSKSVSVDGAAVAQIIATK